MWVVRAWVVHGRGTWPWLGEAQRLPRRVGPLPSGCAPVGVSSKASLVPPAVHSGVCRGSYASGLWSTYFHEIWLSHPIAPVFQSCFSSCRVTCFFTQSFTLFRSARMPSIQPSFLLFFVSLPLLWREYLLGSEAVFWIPFPSPKCGDHLRLPHIQLALASGRKTRSSLWFLGVAPASLFVSGSRFAHLMGSS